MPTTGSRSRRDGFLRKACLGLLLLPALVSAELPGISGRVSDSDTGAPIADANIRIQDEEVGTVSDREGNFVIADLAPGTYTVRATRIGYEPRQQKVTLTSGMENRSLTLRLTAAVLELGEVTVTPGAFRFMDRSAAATRQTMSRTDVETAPQFSDDIFLAIHRLPGLAAGDYAARFSIRGGRDDETLILLDGMEIYEPYHMKDFNEGAISIVDVETIDGVELMTGGFPVRFGNRRSGVFHIHSRTPPIDGPNRHSVGLSVMNLRGMSEGSFSDGRGSWFVSGRRGYLDLVLSLMNINDISAPVYYDLFSKVTWKLTPNHDLAVRLLHAGDSFAMDEFATTGFQDTVATHETANNSYGNSYLWASVTSAISNRVTVETMLNAGLVTRDRAGAELFTEQPEGVYDLDKRSDLRLVGIKQDWLVESSASLLWQFGLDLRRQQAEYRYWNLVWQDPNDPSGDPLDLYPVTTSTEGKENGLQSATYGAGRLRLTPHLTVEAGLRLDRASHTNDSDLSPRLSAMYDLPKDWLLRLAWGQYRQMHDIHDETALAAGGRYDSSELSTQWTGGIEHMFADGTGLRVEVYDKRSDNPRPVFRNWVAGALDVFPETNEDLLLVDLKETTSRGVEIYLNHDSGRRFAWRGSYALSRTRERLAAVDNINVPDESLQFAAENDAPRDQRHAANLDLIWRPDPNWTVNFAVAYHSGWPITVAVAEPVIRSGGEPDIVARPQELYSSRLPSYQRADVRLTRRYSIHRGDVRLFLELINLANRENVFAYDYERAVDSAGSPHLSQDTESWFPLLPSIGMSWTW